MDGVGGEEVYEDSDFFFLSSEIDDGVFHKDPELSQFFGEDKFNTGYIEFESLIKHSDIWYLVGSASGTHRNNSVSFLIPHSLLNSLHKLASS